MTPHVDCPACFSSGTNIHNPAVDEPCPYCCGACYVSAQMAQDYRVVRHLIVYAPNSPLPSSLKPYAAFIERERVKHVRA